jgi:DNA (cytosine-5)-methyltransferase 1
MEVLSARCFRGIYDLTSQGITSRTIFLVCLILTRQGELDEQNPKTQNSAYKKDESLAEHIEFDLDDFTIYKPEIASVHTGWAKTTGDLEMVPLHALKKSKAQCDRLLLSGTLSVGVVKHHVEGLPFETLSISGYNDLDCHSVIKMWVQTDQAKVNNVWYRLRNPAPEYARYYSPFVWIAMFSKHFVDYLVNHPNVELRDFKLDFQKWIFQHHHTSIHFREWLKQYGSTDFRVVVAAQYEFLWKEATDIDESLRRRFIWKEIYFGMLGAVKPQPAYISKSTRTIVTPFVFDCFKYMYFSKVLEPQEYPQSVFDTQQLRKRALGFCTEPNVNQISTTALEERPPQSVQRGDVVSVPRDIQTKWVDKAEIWLGKCI